MGLIPSNSSGKRGQSPFAFKGSDPFDCNGNNGNANNGNGSTGTGGGNTKAPYDYGGSFLYFYHPDHLGSTSYVTDDEGALYEHVQYFPFGETWVEEKANTIQRVPYRYTSKELDEETGLYYFGARYYDPRTSVWQSADPVLGQYLDGKRGMGGIYNPANLALYTYTHQNPVNLIDPDGRSSRSRPGGNGIPESVKANLGLRLGPNGWYASRAPAPQKPQPQKQLLPTEGRVASYRKLQKAGTKGDNITPHHIPSANHMAKHGVKKADGISINMEQPPKGGRHRQTFTYGNQADVKMSPRDALAAGIKDARKIYQREGLYGPEIRKSLQDVSKQNQIKYLKMFQKGRTE